MAKRRDTPQGEFYGSLMPNMMTPRRHTFTLEVEVYTDIDDVRAMSRQTKNADASLMDDLIKEAQEIIDDLDSIEDIIHEDVALIGSAITSKWPLHVRVTLQSVGRDSGSKVHP